MSSAGKKDKGKLPVLDKLKAADMNMMVLKRIDAHIEEVRHGFGCYGPDQVLYYPVSAIKNRSITVGSRFMAAFGAGQLAAAQQQQQQCPVFNKRFAGGRS